MTEYHAPGLGEVHSEDHKEIITCFVADKSVECGEVVSNELAQKVCDALNGRVIDQETLNRILNLLCTVGHVGVPIGDYGQPFELGETDIQEARSLYEYLCGKENQE